MLRSQVDLIFGFEFQATAFLRLLGSAILVVVVLFFAVKLPDVMALVVIVRLLKKLL